MTDETSNESNVEGEEGTTTVTETESLFEKTNAAALRIETANKKQEELLNRQEELYAKQKLGGISTAGKEPEKPKEIGPKEYVDEVMRTGKAPNGN